MPVLLVCGGRDFKDVDLLNATLDRVLQKYGHDDLTIIHGNEPNGADMLAEKWAKANEVDYRGFPARWKLRGKAAGPIRNVRMRDEATPDACIAFRGGVGTQGMIDIMRRYGVQPWLVGWAE